MVPPVDPTGGLFLGSAAWDPLILQKQLQLLSGL